MKTPGVLRVRIVSVTCAFVILCCNAAQSAAGDTAMFTDEWFAERIKMGIKAPDFPRGFPWLNTGGRGLHFNKELKGRLVVIDFWTYCCINCMHILPDLAYLEEKYAGKPLVILGCHSAKFDNEQNRGNIRQAILRYNIRHPVVIDENNTIWDAFTVNSWPTLVVIDAEGTMLAMFSGEGHREELDALIGSALAYYGKKKVLAADGLSFPAESAVELSSGLLFPGKVLMDAGQKRLFISDSNHNRVVAANLDGNHLFTIGSGSAGRRDGSFSEAEFDRPQGMALHKGILYIADTENHLIRTADLQKKTVQTVAGTGRQTREYFKTGRGIALSSPWDLAVAGSTLYIAMAGTHQIWSMDMETMIVSTYAGSSREFCTDGPRLEAAFAQPSGLSCDGRYLYVADSEVSSIRRLDLASDGRVETIAGSKELFDFGLRDGRGETARFQHPLGVAASAGAVFVADTYNHAIRRIDREGTVETVLKSAGTKDVLYEPGGVAAGDQKLYIADTNNHRIQVFDLKTNQVRTLNLSGITPLQKKISVDTITGPQAVHYEDTMIKLQQGAKGEIRVTLSLPAGQHLLDGYPAQYHIKLSDTAPIIISDQSRSGSVSKAQFAIPFTARTSGEGTLEVETVYGYCSDKDKLCIPREVVWKTTVAIVPEGGRESIELIDKP